jgi:hypothetical protein
MRAAVCGMSPPRRHAGPSHRDRGGDGGQDQVFCTTIDGNFDVMSFARSAIFTAMRRAICL